MRQHGRQPRVRAAIFACLVSAMVVTMCAAPTAVAGSVLPAAHLVATESHLRLPEPLSREAAFASGKHILIAGGLRNGGTTRTILSLNLATAAVTRVGKLRHAVHDAAAGDLGGQLFVVGGGNLAPEAWVQAVTPGGTPGTVAKLPKARADLSVATVGDQLIVVGGGIGPVVDKRVLATTDGVHFHVIARLLKGVRYAAVAAMNGKVFVIGGEVGSGDTAAVQIIDVASGTVTLGKPLPTATSHATALVVGGELLVLGGRHNGAASSLIRRIDPVDGSETTAGHLPYKVSDAAGVVLAGKGYLIGGENTTRLDTIIVVRLLA